MVVSPVHVPTPIGPQLVELGFFLSLVMCVPGEDGSMPDLSSGGTLDWLSSYDRRYVHGD